MATRAFSFIIALAMIFSSAGLGAAQAQPQSQLFETKAKQAFMIDAETGTILFSKDAGQADPAGLARQADDDGSGVQRDQGRPLSLDDTFAVSENAWTNGGAKSGGSTMFAEAEIANTPRGSDPGRDRAVGQ